MNTPDLKSNTVTSADTVDSPNASSGVAAEEAVSGSLSAFANNLAQLPLHVNARGLALGVIATVSFVFALQWAQKFLIPITCGIFLAYTLNPLVVWLERRRIARIFGSTIVTLVLLCGAGAVMVTLQGEFQSIIEELPQATHKLSRLLGKLSDGQPSTLQQMQAAATEIVRATTDTEAPRKLKKSSVAEAPDLKIMDWVWAGSMGVLGFIGQAVMLIFLVFFLLLSGDTFKRKLVKLTGPSLRQKKITVHILDEINSSIQNYMLMLLVTNILLALLTWIALRFIGLQNAGAWAVAAGLLHIMPYFGSLIITFATGLAVFMQFESFRMVLLVSAISMGIATLIGTFVTTWMTGKIAKMNPAAVFVSLLFWGWLWGVWGLLLGIPVIVILKVVAERVEGMEVVAELLSE